MRPATATDAFSGEKQHAVIPPLATSTLLGADGCVTVISVTAQRVGPIGMSEEKDADELAAQMAASGQAGEACGWRRRDQGAEAETAGRER